MVVSIDPKLSIDHEQLAAGQTTRLSVPLVEAGDNFPVYAFDGLDHCSRGDATEKDI